MPPPELHDLITALRRADVLRSVVDLLQWDEQVNLPPESGPRRAEQLAAIAERQHQAATDPQLGRALAALEAQSGGLSEAEQALLRCARRDYDRATRLPPAFVAARARLESEAFHAWREARAGNDFARFAPLLERQLQVAREEAAYLGFGDRPYDYHIDKHDPGLTAAEVERLFAGLRAGLVPFVRAITVSPARPRRANLPPLPVPAQDALLREVVAALGFDFGRGRIDVAVHPFCSGDAADTRMTTRFREDEPLESLFSAIHETGHGLYTQGLPREHLGTPLGEAVGMAVHESQSRLWENQVGRSRAFWRHFEPRLRAAYADGLADISSDELHLLINAVRLNPIRTESDEVTYNLHILLRFELEQRLFAGTLAVADLPAAWNELSRELLGLTPPDDAHGVLQDVHWSGGAFGYFPSYCLGNMIAAQLWERARETLTNLEEDFARGQFDRLRQWLRANIHQHGRRYDTRELVRRVTGAELSPEPLLRYLEERYAPLYLPPKR